MSKFCMTCGTRLFDDDQFCPECGAPAPYPAPAPMRQRTTLPKKQSSTASTVFLIVFAVLFVVEILLMLFWHPGFLA